MEHFTPKEIVDALDRYIIGQDNAKKAVAIALRNRYRRSLLSEDMRDEITPKNIILMGPTGVGKTEIARRLAKLVEAPFVKVEATKFTEVGYVGRDVESMIRDLVEASIRLEKNKKLDEVIDKAKAAAEDRLLDVMLPGKRKKRANPFLFLAQDSQKENPPEEGGEEDTGASMEDTREKLRARLREGKMEDASIEIEVEESGMSGMAFMPGGDDNMVMQLQDMMGNLFPKKKKKRKTSVKEARNIFEQEEAQKLIDIDEVVSLAIQAVEQHGIVFLDEIDKITGGSIMGQGPDVSREGVQRDILPIVEGTTVMTKYGPVKTDFILFIAAGAFHVAKVSDLIPELQGRFPIQVALESLTEENFRQILTQPENAVIKQQKALMEVEGVTLDFADDAIEELAHYSYLMNQTRENIGARRLHTVMEKVLEELSFTADRMKGAIVNVDRTFVQSALKEEATERDLKRYIL
jgi:ATP-dependent HslUV protease ATP-binding subunit HslU